MSGEGATYFISYSRKDDNFRTKLAQELHAAGVNVWFDEKDISGGQRWTESITEAIKSCNSVIFIMSPQSINSRNVMNEIRYATGHNRKIIPIMYQQCDPPLDIISLNYIDFRENFNESFRKLLDTVEVEVAPGGRRIFT